MSGTKLRWIWRAERQLCLDPMDVSPSDACPPPRRERCQCRRERLDDRPGRGRKAVHDRDRAARARSSPRPVRTVVRRRHRRPRSRRRAVTAPCRRRPRPAARPRSGPRRPGSRIATPRPGDAHTAPTIARSRPSGPDVGDPSRRPRPASERRRSRSPGRDGPTNRRSRPVRWRTRSTPGWAPTSWTSRLGRVARRAPGPASGARPSRPPGRAAARRA